MSKSPKSEDYDFVEEICQLLGCGPTRPGRSR